MKKLLLYVDASVIGGCEDAEFKLLSRRLWKCLEEGQYRLVISKLTLAELKGAPLAVRKRMESVPAANVMMLADTDEAAELAEAYLRRGVVGPGSRADAHHVALASVAGVDVLVSWNFKHMVNLGRIRRFHAVNLELGYGALDIRTPPEVLNYEQIL